MGNELTCREISRVVGRILMLVAAVTAVVYRRLEFLLKYSSFYVVIFVHIHTHIYVYTHIYIYIYVCISVAISAQAKVKLSGKRQRLHLHES